MNAYPCASQIVQGNGTHQVFQTRYLIPVQRVPPRQQLQTVQFLQQQSKGNPRLQLIQNRNVLRMNPPVNTAQVVNTVPVSTAQVVNATPVSSQVPSGGNRNVQEEVIVIDVDASCYTQQFDPLEQHNYSTTLSSDVHSNAGPLEQHNYSTTLSSDVHSNAGALEQHNYSTTISSDVHSHAGALEQHNYSTTMSSDVPSNAGIPVKNYSGQIHIIPNAALTTQAFVGGGVTEDRNVLKPDCQKAKPQDRHLTRIMKIPEPTQVKINTDLKDKIAHLKIYLSGSFLSWNMAGRTILDLNFMRNLFCITNMDIVFQSDHPYERGLCDGLNKLLHNKLFTDWLVLKCEEKQIPFFKVNDQVEVYSVDNFTALLTIIASESCLPLPFITGDEKNRKYFYLNFSKSANNRVKKLNWPIFHDADNGRKKIPCKYPGVRLDCTFESAIQSFVIHVHKSAVPAFNEYVSYIRQVIIYNHIVWGFLQAWTRRVREQYNGCFKTQEIAQNLSLCRSDPSETAKPSAEEVELQYYIDYSDFYLKFDPVALRDTTVKFTIENFETNYVCDVSIVQYYRQFFLINDMHYSDALKNIIMFSKENGASNVTDFVYMPQKTTTNDNAEWSNGFYPPGGISRPTTKAPQAKKPQAKPNIPAGLDVNGTKTKSSAPIGAEKSLNTSKAPPFKPLIKTRTVEEINSSVEAQKTAGVPPPVNPNPVSCEQRQVPQARPPCVNLPPCILDSLHNCYLRNAQEICSQDVTSEPKKMQKMFNYALCLAKEMNTIDTFMDKMYTTLQISFTNATTQQIMNRTILTALDLQFPHLRSLLKPYRPPRTEVGPSPETVQKPRENVIPAKRAKAVNPPTPKKAATPQKKTPITPPKRKPHTPTKPSESSPETKPREQSIPAATPSKTVQSEKKHNRDSSVTPKSKPRKPGTQSSSKIVPTINLDESDCNIDVEIIVNVQDPVSNETEKVASDEKKSKRSDESANATVMETEDSISINLTLPLTNVETAPTGDVQSETEKNDRVARREQSMQTDESSFSDSDVESTTEKDLLAKYKIKPCSVSLNANDVSNHMRKREGQRKKRRKSIYAESSDNSDADDELWIQERRSTRNAKRISDLQYMEARTRVLQRLRKRNQMYVLGNHGQKVYTSDELNQFIVRSRRGSVSSLSTQLEKSDEDEEEKKYKKLYEECLTRKVKIVLVRLEETEESKKKVGKWKVQTMGDSRLTLTRDSATGYDSIPKNKRRYFEIKDGQVYLKKQYEVLNGRIVLIKRNEEQNRQRLKNEPNLPQNDLNSLPDFIKEEVLTVD